MDVTQGNSNDGATSIDHASDIELLVEHRRFAWDKVEHAAREVETGTAAAQRSYRDAVLRYDQISSSVISQLGVQASAMA